MTAVIPHNALIVVADGAKATLFRNTGKGGEIALHEERKLTPSTLVNDGPSGSRPTEQSISQTSEATFAKHLAQSLTAMHSAGDYTAMVLIADPKTLGEVRSALHKGVADSIIQSMSKDLTNHPMADIAAALRK